MRKQSRWISCGLLTLTLACGGEEGSDRETQSALPEAAQAAAATGSAGSFELGDTSYPFRIVQCDLTGNRPDDVLLRGAGTAPDGRPLTVLVERRAGAEVVAESATLYFGSIVDGDHWTATRTRLADGRWTRGAEMHEPADGPLLQLSGAEIVAEELFVHETDDSSRRGILRATCG